MKKILVGLMLCAIAQGAGFAQTDEVQLTEKETCIKQILANDYKYNSFGFFTAITDGNTKYVDLFLKAGMDPNTTYLKVPALYTAIAAKQPSIVELLLDAGVNPNQQFGGLTPLMYAIRYKDNNIVKSLIAHGANVNSGSATVTPLNYAIRKKDTPIVETLVNAGALVSDDDMTKAIKSKNPEIKNLVLKQYKVEE